MAEADDAPWLWIISGPNGSGKTTFALESLNEIAGDVPFINIDRIAAGIDPSLSAPAMIAAGSQALRETKARLGAGDGFAIETTLSGRFHQRLVTQAIAKNWETGFVFLWIASPELAVRRVAERVAQGGHDVPTEVVERRYRRGLANLPWFLETCGRAAIYDNVGRIPKLVAQFEHGRATIHAEATYRTIMSASRSR